MTASRATIIAAVIGAAAVIIAAIITAVYVSSGGPVKASGAKSSGLGSSSSSSPSAQLPSPTSKPSPVAPSSSQYLEELTPVANSGSLNTGGAEANGSFFAQSVMLYLNPGPASVEYNLGRHWQRLVATVGLRDDSAENQRFQFQAFADGRLIYNHTFALGQSRHISLDVTGVLRLELVVTIASDYVGPAYAVWGNASLTS